MIIDKPMMSSSSSSSGSEKAANLKCVRERERALTPVYTFHLPLLLNAIFYSAVIDKMTITAVEAEVKVAFGCLSRSRCCSLRLNHHHNHHFLLHISFSPHV